MLIAARNAMMTKSLPYDAQVEYLESTGTQWIDTGISLQTADRFVFATMIKRAGTHRYWTLFGCNSNANELLIWFPYENKIYLNGRVYNNVFDYNTEYIVDVITTNGAASLSVNNTVIATNAGNNNGKKIYLFGSIASATSNNIDSYNWQKYLYCKIYNQEIIVRDFIPVRFTNKQSQTEGAMYDRVSGELFRNQGTGAFVIGPDVAGGGYKYKCVRRSYRRSLRPSARFRSRFTPHLWKEVA